MSKKKSLGSSPVGFQTQGSMSFIPDLGVSKSKKKPGKASQKRGKKAEKKSTQSVDKASQEKNSGKKTVSYYLEKDLVTKVKSIATEKEICYSALVSDALRRWINENG